MKSIKMYGKTPNGWVKVGMPNGNMNKDTYDSNYDGIVDKADKVSNKLIIRDNDTYIEYDGSTRSEINLQPYAKTDVVAKFTPFSITLSASEWEESEDCMTYVIPKAKVSSQDVFLVGLEKTNEDSETELATFSGIDKIITSKDTITVYYVGDEPTVDITLQFVYGGAY